MSFVLFAGIAAIAGANDESPRAVTARAVTAGGDAFAARLTAVDAAWNFTFDSGGETRKVAAADLVRWGSPSESSRGPVVLLSHGDAVVCDRIEMDGDFLVVTTDLLGKAKISLDVVRGIVFRPAGNRRQRDRLAFSVQTDSGSSDRVILVNGDQLGGTLLELTDERILLETQAGRFQTEIDDVTALVFNPELTNSPRPSGLRAVVGLRDGSRLTARSLIVDHRLARITLAGGLAVTTKPSSVVSVQPFGGGVTYVSDLNPVEYKHEPFLSLPWKYRADRNVLGGRLRAGGRLYLKGLGMHSASSLTYRLDAQYKRLEAELGIDGHAGKRGSVVFRVVVDDGTGNWTPRYTSPIVRGGAAPVRMSVDVTGARLVRLSVDFADRGDEMDHADWLDVRLIR